MMCLPFSSYLIYASMEPMDIFICYIIVLSVTVLGTHTPSGSNGVRCVGVYLGYVDGPPPCHGM